MKSARIAILISILGLAVAMLVLVLPAIGQSGDYGVNTGAHGCGQTHYCTPTPVVTGTPPTPAPTNTMAGPNFGNG